MITIRRITLIAYLALIALVLSPSAGSALAQTDDNSVPVQPADTLLDLSLFYGVAPSDLAQMNDLSSAPIGAGDSLVVPAVSAPSSAPAVGGPVESQAEPPAAAPVKTPVSTQPEVSTNPGDYTIQPGDTLFRIATRYGVALKALAYVNDIVTPDTIYVGQQLKIPDGSEVIPDEPPSTPQPEALVVTPPLTGTGGTDAVWMGEGKHILVVLSQQTTYAFENGNLLGQFLSSTGLPGTPTVTGDFAIYIKLDSQRMVGPGYDLPGVPWVMYFYQGYGLHGTYWHNNFGHPMSHGCVNLRTGDAAWMYTWAPLGTPVHVVP